MTPSQIVLYAARRCTKSLAQHQHTLEAQASIRQEAKMEKTWTYRELELRKTIVKEIESKYLSGLDERDEFDTMWNNGMKYAAEIVRGVK